MPDHRIFRHDLFKDPQYLVFESQVLAVCDSTDQLSPRLKKLDAIPEAVEAFTATKNMAFSIRNQVNCMQQQLNGFTSLIQDLVHSPNPFHWGATGGAQAYHGNGPYCQPSTSHNPSYHQPPFQMPYQAQDPLANPTSSPAPINQGQVQSNPQVSTVFSSSNANIGESSTSNTNTRQSFTSNTSDDRQRGQPPHISNQPPPPLNASHSSTPSRVPQGVVSKEKAFTMSQHYPSVTAFVYEWEHVQKLEAQHGRKWRSTDAESKHYNRYRCLHDWICYNGGRNGNSISAFSGRLEELRLRKGWGMNVLRSRVERLLKLGGCVRKVGASYTEALDKITLQTLEELQY